jgi:dTDP-4-dehydrorhamnose reductase
MTAGPPSAAASVTNRRVLITGAAGQLGSYLRPALERTGAEVVGTGRQAAQGVDLVADITDPRSIEAAIRTARPDFIIHAAAWTDVDGCERDPQRADAVNATGSANVAAAARRAGAHLVAVSTDFVFSGDDAPYAEDAETRPRSIYGRTKLEAERAVLAVDPGFAIARTAWLYGGSGKHFPRTVLTVLRDRGSMEVVADESGSPTFAGDLAEALVPLAGSRAAGVFHLVNEGRASRFELARRVATIAGFDPEMIEPTTTAEFLQKYPLPAARPPDSELSNSRAAALGIRLRRWEQAVDAYVPLLAVELDLPLLSGERATA